MSATIGRMIGTADTLTGTPCPWCGQPIGMGFAIREVAPDEYVTICSDCDLVSEGT